MFSWNVAGVWLDESATIEWMTVSSSATLGDVREQVGDPQAALAALAERPVVLPQQADLAEERLRLLGAGQRLPWNFASAGL